jgi:hypothetical protein
LEGYSNGIPFDFLQYFFGLMHELWVCSEVPYVISMVPPFPLFLIPLPYNCIPDAASGQHNEDAELKGFNLKMEVLRSFEGQ